MKPAPALTLADFRAILPHIAIEYDGNLNPRATLAADPRDLPYPFRFDDRSSAAASWRASAIRWVGTGLAAVQDDLATVRAALAARIRAVKRADALTPAERAHYTAADAARIRAEAPAAARALLSATLGGYAPPSLLAELTPLVEARRVADAEASQCASAIRAAALAAHAVVRDAAIEKATATGYAVWLAQNSDAPEPARKWGPRR